mmetsp:Transcript_105163/g.234687  ORF Transcript_105163/g.234687 Transcript_105163/m.234687 type:complete len:355 (+) Transcript_105163:601-1665(+)
MTREQPIVSNRVVGAHDHCCVVCFSVRRVDDLAPVTIADDLEEGARSGCPDLQLEGAALRLRGCHWCGSPVIPTADDGVGTRWGRTRSNLLPIYSAELALHAHAHPILVARDATVDRVCLHVQPRGLPPPVIADGRADERINIPAIDDPAVLVEDLLRAYHGSALLCPRATRVEHAVGIAIQTDLEALPTRIAQRDGDAPDARLLRLHILRLPAVESALDAVASPGILFGIHLSAALRPEQNLFPLLRSLRKDGSMRIEDLAPHDGMAVCAGWAAVRETGVATVKAVLDGFNRQGSKTFTHENVQVGVQNPQMCERRKSSVGGTQADLDDHRQTLAFKLVPNASHWGRNHQSGG